jgi:prenyltransferase beta subunit
MNRFTAIGCVPLLLLCGAVAVGQDANAVAAARTKGLDWLTKNQAADGSWGKTYSIATTGFACLAYLSAADEPYTDDRGRALVKGLRFLLAQQKDGLFPQQGHTWIHGQGFGTLALSEAYGRSLFVKVKPDMDMQEVRAAVGKAAAAIAKHQSASGGWWYTPGSPEQHEGSTTVCAVQALVSAANYGIPTDAKALDHGFDYLKKCQSPDGGFNYRLGDGTSMKEGTAGDVATLGLMQKFDFPVMIKGYQFLIKLTPAAISAERFPYYGHFYGCMGMQLLGQEYKDDKAFREGTKGYIAGAQKDLLAWQQPDGSWPAKGWIATGGQEDARYATAFATLTLFVPEARLSVYNRTPPKLPAAAEGK